jgi:transposase
LSKAETAEQGTALRNNRIWQRMLGAPDTVVERVEFDPDRQVLVVHARPAAGAQGRCGRCGRRGAWFDRGRGRRRWRALDLGAVRVMLEAAAPRVLCHEHGPTVIAVPWARHDAGHTREFDAQVCWLATQTSKSATVILMRISWRTVGAILTCGWADIEADGGDRLAGLTRIGIDEICWRKPHRFLTVVVDHDTHRVVWVAEGRGRKVLSGFFHTLGRGRCGALTRISADAADWITASAREHAPQALRVMDPYHVVAWATQALDTERRRAWRAARARTEPTRRGHRDGTPRLDSSPEARAMKHARWALWKNPEDLTDNQRAALTWIAATDPCLYLAYQLKEGLRQVFALTGVEAITALNRWINWAQDAGITAFSELAHRITTHRTAIKAALTTGLSNALVESLNAKIRLIIRRGFGFHTAHAVIALIMLSLGGNKPQLPGRA